MKRNADTAALVSVALSVAVSFALSVVPAYTSGTQSRTLLQMNGLAGVVVLLLPVFLNLVGLAESRGLRALAGTTLLAFSFVSATGPCYIPSAVILLVAAYRTTHRTKADEPLGGAG